MLPENGKFYRSALQHRNEQAEPRAVRVYERIHQGIWSYNGMFPLVDAWRERAWKRADSDLPVLKAAQTEDAALE